MPHDVLLTQVVFISVLVNIRFCDILYIVTCLVQDLMTLLPWRTGAGYPSLLARISSKLWKGIHYWTYKYRSACYLQRADVWRGLLVCASITQSGSSQCIITISLEEFPAVYLRLLLGMQFALRSCTDNISQAVAIFCSPFRSLRRWDWDLSRL